MTHTLTKTKTRSACKKIEHFWHYLLTTSHLSSLPLLLNLFLVLFIAFVFVFVLLDNLAVEGSAYQPQPRPPAQQWSRRPQRQSQVLPKCETPQILSEQLVVGISLSVCLAHYHKFLLTFEPDLQEIKITSTHFPVFAIHCH